MLLTPIVVGLVLVGDTVAFGAPAAVSLFLAAAATDLLDGFLARRWGATSDRGAFLDTTADKFLVAGTLIALVAVDQASPWVALIIVGREILMLGLRAHVAARGTVVRPSRAGKWKANLQFGAVAVAIVAPPFRLGALPLHEWLLWAAAGLTLSSGVGYLRRYRLAESEGGHDAPGQRHAPSEGEAAGQRSIADRGGRSPRT